MDLPEDSPWAIAPIADCGAGGAACLNMVLAPQLDERCAFIAQTARAHGLVCFDPQVHELRP